MGLLSLFKNGKLINSNNESINLNASENLSFDEKNKKFKNFEEYYEQWKFKNNELLFQGEEFYKNKCCIKCGVLIGKEIKTQVICSECSSKMIVRTNPDTKNKCLILEKDKDEFDKLKQKFRELKVAQEQLDFIFDFHSQYKEQFNNFKNKFSVEKGYTALDVIYHFQNLVSVQEEKQAEIIYHKLIEKNELNFRNIHLVTDKLLGIDFLEIHNLELLFLQKKYNDLYSYLPLYTYRVITRGFFIRKLKDLNIETEESIANACGSPLYNLILKLLKECNMTLNELKKYYFEYVNENITMYPMDLEKIWSFIEIGVKRNLKYNEEHGFRDYIVEKL